MSALSEPDDRAGPSFNHGEIVETGGYPRWRTTVGRHDLTLDIVPVGRLEDDGPEVGIASFVVMEQKPSFLDDVAAILADAIAQRFPTGDLILLTAEAKGSYCLSWVYRVLRGKVGSRLHDRVIVFRKGEPKVYMQRPAVFRGRHVDPPAARFRSITSAHEQTLRLSPRDTEYLLAAVAERAEPVIVDDFIGTGGTIVATCRIFEQLHLDPPVVAAVFGSDGDLYRDTFSENRIQVTPLPQPFPLRLPTFVRESSSSGWQTR
jgi:hypothetical protein